MAASCRHTGRTPIRIVKWKIQPGSRISHGTGLLLYKNVDSEAGELCKLKSECDGTVDSLVTPEGAVANPGDVLFELALCTHPVVMKDLCAECGADLRQLGESVPASADVASVSMIHNVPELRVTQEQAHQLGKADEERLRKLRKLVLLVDLDQTLIHTTSDDVPADMKGVHHFQLYGPQSSWYHTRVRPRTQHFLEQVSQLYELHICTFGARPYAHAIAALLDPDGRFFSYRILSRDECFNPTSKTGNLRALFPCGDSMVCIIDDREDVWNYAPNLVPVKPYVFFNKTGDINAPLCPRPESSFFPLPEETGECREARVGKANRTVQERDTAAAGDAKISTANDTGTRAAVVADMDRDLDKGVAEGVVEKDATTDKKEASEVADKDGDTEEDTAKSANEYNRDMDTATDSHRNADKIVAKDRSEGVKKDAAKNSDESKDKDTTTDRDKKEAEVEDQDAIGDTEKDTTTEDRHEDADKDATTDSGKSAAKVGGENTDEGADKDTSGDAAKNADEGKDKDVDMEKATSVDQGRAKDADKDAMQGRSGVPSRVLDDLTVSSEEEDEGHDEKRSKEAEDEDDYLLYLEEILRTIHTAYFAIYDQMGSEDGSGIPDLKHIVPYVRRKVLKEAHLVFSGVVPTNQPAEKSRAWQVAKALGATVSRDLCPGVTHLVAARLGTAKVNKARRMPGVHVVHPSWLWCCAERWEHVAEGLFPVGPADQPSQRQPPPATDSRLPKEPLPRAAQVARQLTEQPAKAPVYDPVTGKRIWRNGQRAAPPTPTVSSQAVCLEEPLGSIK
ncbi:RNA polymerase II subunit A C-terminal domain phosphatase-like isoform X2 [Amblyomma americanum]